MAKAKPNKRLYPFRKVDQEMIDAILKDIKEGSPNKHAAESNGITETTFYNLIAQGMVDMALGMDTLQSRLVVSLREIEKNEIKECRKKIKKGKFGHKGAEWTLEHAYWRYFSNNAPAKELAEELERMKAEANLMKGGSHEQVNSKEAKQDPQE